MTREALFTEAIVQGYHCPDAPRELPPVEAIRKLVSISCDPVAPGAVDIVLAHLRSIAIEPAQSLLRIASETGFIERLAAILPGDDAVLRAELITSILFGLRIRRDIVEAGALEQNA